MRRVDIQIPPNVDCDVIGYLYDCDDPVDRGQDMLEVALDNGILIAAGWYPEGRRDGSYVVSVTRGFDRLIDPVTASDVFAAALITEELISLFSMNPIEVSNSVHVSFDDPVYV